MTLTHAKRYALVGMWDDMLRICSGLQEQAHAARDTNALMHLGALLQDFGFLSQARKCFECWQRLDPADLRPRAQLANLARDAGQHATSRALFAALLAQAPDALSLRRNALVSLEYDPAATDEERLGQASAWGEWALCRAGGAKSRPMGGGLGQRALRVGYVSADFCQHTVGLFIRAVLVAHDSSRVQPFAYSAGSAKDWVTDDICAATEWRDVSALDDAGLAATVRADSIDVLVDVSGHTAGSRLTAFACRPAPVMVSWLGYFATTGLPYVDAVLLDEWHAPAGSDSQFVERVIRLPAGRMCYQPVPWAPDQISPPPHERNGFVTFGSFNNTGKYSALVFDVWARVLGAVPASRLVLKWRTFNDQEFCESVKGEFACRGIAPERLDLRGPSFHADLLKEYADIDIALDPFPFTGGMTSCEALWMGVPVVTWPQGRVVSRQTWAFLNQIGVPELAAHDADTYVQVAAALAHDRPRLKALRASLRDQMRTSPLMDVTGFTRSLELTLTALHAELALGKTHATPAA